MKKTLSLSFMLIICCVSVLSAQSYSALWRNVQKDVEKDLPASALKVVEKIHSRAVREGNDGQRLQAALARLSLKTSISPDSLSSERAYFEHWLSTEKRPSVQALLHLALSGLHGPAYNGNDEDNERILAHLRAALSSPGELHKTDCRQFLPAVIAGKDGYVYGHDLLAPLCREAFSRLQDLGGNAAYSEEAQALLRQKEGEVIALYRRNGLHAAVIAQTLDSLERESSFSSTENVPVTQQPRYKLLQTLAAQYASTPAVTDVYALMCRMLREAGRLEDCITLADRAISMHPHSPGVAALKNMKGEILQPRFNATLSSTLLHTGQTATLLFNATHLNAAKVELYRLPLGARHPKLLQNGAGHAEMLRLYARHATYSFHKTFSARPAYESFTDSLTFSLPQTGVYILKVECAPAPAQYIYVYVSNLRMLSLGLPNAARRLVTVDAQSGEPRAGVSIYQYDYNDKLISIHATGADGSLLLPAEKDLRRGRFFIEKGEDHACPALGATGSAWFISAKDSAHHRHMWMYTDRAIYRPGQTVHASAIVYDRQLDETAVLSGDSCIFVLRDANDKEISRATSVTDSFGTATAQFVLPSKGLPGRYRITAGSGNSVAFRVEEYKRPTFQVALDKITDAYEPGDTVRLTGRATAYSGTGVADAAVSYSVSRQSFWPFHANNGRSVWSDTVQTDGNGRFTLSVPLVTDRKDAYFHFSVSVDVLSPDGETESAGTSLFTGREPLRLTTTWPDKWCRERGESVCFELLNTQGVQMKARGSLSVLHNGHAVYSGSFTTDSLFRLPQLNSCPSGLYTLEARIAGMADSVLVLSRTFALFSLTDTLPADTTNAEWFYATGDVLSPSVPLTVQIGSPCGNVTVFYDLFSGDKCIESRRLHLNSSVVSIPYIYKDEYGDGLVALFAFMKDGVLHTRLHRMRKPEPEKRLTLRWSAFRDRLTPGSRETWRLHVLDKNGNPAGAQVMAVLYDAALDKFAQNPFHAPSLYYPRVLPFVRWRGVTGNSAYLNGWQDIQFLKVAAPVYDQLGDYWPASGRSWQIMPRRNRLMRGRQLSLLYKETADVAYIEAETADISAAKSAAVSVSPKAAGNAMADAVGGTAVSAVAPVDASLLRSNFSETAFFMPQLQTDAQGEVCMAFTLPQSLTTWNFYALAHSPSMDWGVADTAVTVQKEFMATANLPRFLRSGDRTRLIVTLRNMSARRATGRVRLELTDAETQTRLYTSAQKFDITTSSHGQYAFSVEAPRGDRLLICRVLAEGSTFSDGEQTYLPVLETRSRITESVPFSLSGAREHTVLTGDTLFARGSRTAGGRTLRVEYTDNPAWYAVMALPQMADVRYENALSLASAYYAATLAAHIAENSPALRRAALRWKSQADSASLNPLERNVDARQLLLDETPWARQADDINARLRSLGDLFDSTSVNARRHSLLLRLTRLQQADGSWCWFKGMEGSFYVTLRVADLLARLQELSADTAARAAVDRGLSFLTQKVVKRVDEMKKAERGNSPAPGLDEGLIRYLDVCCRTGYKPGSAGRAATGYLVRRLASSTTGYSMLQKALCANVQAKTGHTAQARLTLQGILEHTVTTPQMGRYFDTRRAESFPASYQMPVQTAVIETVRRLRPDDGTTLSQLLTWVIQSKRTQAWSDNLAAADAVYALLCHGKGQEPFFSPDAKAAPRASVSLTLNNGRTATPLRDSFHEEGTLGLRVIEYDAASLPAAPHALHISKHGEGLSWGALYAGYSMDNSQVRTAGNELRVVRTVLRETAGRWLPLTDGQALHTGERIKVRYVITAARSFDFVHLLDPRPACMEPVDALSGYRWNLGGYRAVKDASTSWFFEHMPKGSHTVEEELRVDRSGTFSGGPATVQCCYAPEYVGRHAALTLESKP